MNRIHQTILLSAALLLGASSTYAAVATSTNYSLEKDSINFGGGLGTSTSYELRDTYGEVATGRGTSSSYKLDAGYRQPSDGTAAITITSPADVSLGTLNTLLGESSSGSATWTVTTDNAVGYKVTIESSTDPALTSGSSSFANYTRSSVPDYDWQVAASASEFGFTPEGAHITSTYKDDGATCGVGSSDAADKCWDALSTTAATIAESPVANNPLGTATSVTFRAEIGSSKTQATGSYSATITVTALTL